MTLTISGSYCADQQVLSYSIFGNFEFIINSRLIYDGIKPLSKICFLYEQNILFVCVPISYSYFCNQISKICFSANINICLFYNFIEMFYDFIWIRAHLCLPYKMFWGSAYHSPLVILYYCNLYVLSLICTTVIST